MFVCVCVSLYVCVFVCVKKRGKQYACVCVCVCDACVRVLMQLGDKVREAARSLNRGINYDLSAS